MRKYLQSNFNTNDNTVKEYIRIKPNIIEASNYANIQTYFDTIMFEKVLSL